MPICADQGVVREQLPAEPLGDNAILKQLAEWQGREEGIWKSGKVSGTVYHGGDDLTQLTCVQ